MRKLKLFLTLLMLMCIGVTQMWGGEVTISPSQALNDGGVDPITIACAKGDGTNAPAISSGQLRLYQAGSGKTTGNTITFSSEKTITSIVFTFANNMTASNGSFSEGSYDSESSTWTGSTTSLTLTVTGTTSGTRIYITEMVVTYDGGSTPPADPFTVTLKDDNTELTEKTAGAGVTLPSRDGCDGYTFAGWTKTWTSAQSSWTATAPEIIPAGAYTPAADENLYPVYTKVEGGSGSATPTTKSMTSFDAISGNVDGDENVSYEAAQGNASNAPAVNSNEIRIYQNGGLLTITANNGKKLTSITIGSSMGTTVTYAIDGGDASSNQSISANGTFTLDDIEATTVVFTCTGNSKTTRLYLNNLSVTYSGGGSGSTTYYISEPDCSTPTPPAPACELKVTISKGTPEIGSFSLNKEEGAYETCDAAFEVIVTPAEVEHYHVSEVTASNSTSISGPDADGKYTITYEQETNAASTINVTFVEDTKYDVTWSVNGVESTNKAYHGAHPTLPATPESCDATSTTFIGWAAEAWSGKLAAPAATVYTSADAMPVVEAEGVKYYAVFAKAGEATSVTHTLTIADKTADSNYGSHSEIDDKGATWSGVYNFGDATHIGLNKKADNHYLGSPLFAANVNSVKATIKNGSSSARSAYLRSDNETAQPSSGDLGSVSVPASGEQELTFTLGETAFKQFYVYVSDPLQFHEFVVTLEGAPSYSDYMTTCCTKYNVNIAEGITNGSVSADVAKACEDAVVTLTVTPATNYHLKTLSVMNGETPVEVTENTFTMPAGNVTISATFEEDACTPLATPEVTVSGKAYPYDAVKLAWTAIDNANLYKVYIYDAEDNELEKDEAFEGVEYTIDLDLEASTTYKYSVQAISNTPAVHCPSVAATSTFATDALPKATLTLVDAAGEHASSGDYTILTAFNLPDAAAIPAGCPKVFVGWDADEDCNHAPTYAAGASFTFENTTDVTLHAVYAKEGAPAPVTYPIDFEANADTYTDWTLTNITSKQTDSGVNAHEGDYFGVTAGTATASLVTKEKIANPTLLTVFVSKKSTNTSASTWYAQVSEDGTNWTDVESVNGASMSKGEWVELSADLSSYSNVYVRVYYEGSTAVRVIDDLVLSAIGPKTYSEYGTACEACKVVTLAKSGEDQEKGNTFALKVGDDDVESVQTCEAASVNIVASPATGYQVSFGISELQGASLSENIISLASNTNGELTVTANFTLKNHVVTLAQNPAAGATLVGGKENAHYGETINISTDVPTGYEFINWTSESVEITNATSATGASFTMPDADVTVTANFGKVYTVSFNAGSDPITETAIGAGVVLPAGPAPSEACVAAGWAFAGWAEAAVADETTDAQTLYTGEYHPTSDITLYAVYSRTESGDPVTSYVQVTKLDQVNAGGEFIITNGTKYLPSTTTSSSVAQADMVAITDGVVTGTVVDAMKWNISVADEDGYVTVKNAAAKYLYATNSNSGLRVGDTEDTWKFEEYTVSEILGFAMQEKTNSRWCAVYTAGSDWRPYGEKAHTNYKTNDGRLDLYKAVSAPTSTTYYWSAPECCTPHNVTIADNIEHGTVVANPTSACADATITVTLTPAEGYELTAWTVDGTEQALNATTFTMPNKDVVVSATFSEIVSEAILTLNENGNDVTFAGSHEVGDVVNLPSALSKAEHACDGKVLKGWSTVKITTPVATKPSENFYELNAEYTILTAEDDTLYAVFAEEGAGAETIVQDIINRELTGITGTNYGSWSGKTATSSAVYAGSTAGGNESIQMRSNKSVDGLVTTASGGNARKVTVTWNSNTTSGRTIDIYGKSTAYSAASDLYGENAGTKLGSIIYGTSTELTISADYAFIGIRSNNGALYLTDITIDWGTAGEVTYSNYATSCVAPLANPTFSVDDGEYTSAQTIELSAEEGTIYYTLNGATPTSASTQYEAEAPIVLNDCGTTTIKAIAISANNHSEVVSATYTINIPLPTISEANPYTPAQAIEVFDGNCYNNEMVYVKGVVKTSSGLNTTYGNYDNIVVVAAETTAPEFTFFHMYKGAEKVQFDANDPAIAAGDTIVAYGELTKYGQIYEFKDGCYLIDRKAYNVPKQSIVNDIEHPYTLEDAINFLENAATYDLSGEVYVKGVATTAPNNNNTFTAHDPEAENVFQFYNTNLNELTVGVNDTIIVKGLIKKVNANYRMEAGVVQQVTAYVAPVVPEFTVNPTAVAFGNVEQNAQVDAIELNVELTAIASAMVTLADENGVFSIDKTALTETGVVTVSVVSTATVGNYAATITLYDVAEAAEDVVVNVTMNVTAVETRNIANGSAFTAISGDLDPAHIKYEAFKGDGTTNPAINNSNIRIYKPASEKTTGGYLKLTALMGCTIDQVEITFSGQATASFAVDNAEFSDEAYITNQTSLLTPAALNAQSVSIVNLKNGSIDISAIKVYYNGSPLAIHHYILGGTYETTFEQYGEFSYEGLTVTAAYNEQETITEPIVGFHVVADLMTAGNKKAEVYLGETKIAEYDINVTESPKQNPALAYTPSVQIVPAAEVGDWTAPEFSNTLNVAPISYSSNKPAVATVDENGVIALAGGYGTAVITASFAATEEYAASEATYTVTVQEPIENLTGPWMVAVQSDIKVGMRVIIAGTHDNATKTMGGQNNENNRLAIAATLSNGVLTPATGTKVFELVDAGDGKYAFKGLNGKYLSAAGTGTANVLNEAADYEAANAQWSISFANNGSANIVASSNNRNAMQYNSGSSLFACYASTTSQKPVYLYVNKTEVTEDIDASTLPEGSIVVVNDDVEMTIDQEVSLGDIYVKDGQTLTIEASEDAILGNLDLENGAVWDLNITTPGATVTVNDLILRSNSADRDAQEGKSSQAPGVMPVISGVLALEIDLRPELAADATLSVEQSEMWYCISAPFEVDINSGFEWVYPDGHRTPMVHNVDFQIFEYDGERRATGISGWKRIGGTMKAGVAHFIGFDNARTNQKVIRLTAKTNTITPVTEIALGSYPGATDYQNWNGVANPTLQYIGIDKPIVAFDYGIQDYNTYAADDYNYFVGSPFFIQQDGGSIAIDYNDRGGAIHAPKREVENLEYCVRINAADANSFDGQMYVRASETASNEYEEGHDMASQCSTTPKYGARIWTENYNVRLGIEEAPLTNGNATYVLGIATPSAGEYTISVAAPKENADLYLTYNGSIIWNLSDGAYTVDLAKGVTSGYGLVLQAKAPHVATGVDNAEANEAGVQKVIINDHVYILRAEQMYDVTGKAVK